MSTGCKQPLLRRQVLLGTLRLGALCAMGSCASPASVERKVTLAIAANIPEGDTPFPLKRLMVQRRGSQLRVVSMLCTHQTCELHRTEEGFLCPCHGSEFNNRGAVVQGPASRDLPWYACAIDAQGNVVVDLGVEVGPDTYLTL